MVLKGIEISVCTIQYDGVKEGKENWCEMKENLLWLVTKLPRHIYIDLFYASMTLREMPTATNPFLPPDEKVSNVMR